MHIVSRCPQKIARRRAGRAPRSQARIEYEWRIKKSTGIELGGQICTDRDGLYLDFPAPHGAEETRASRTVWWWMNGEAEGELRGTQPKSSLEIPSTATLGILSRGSMPRAQTHAMQAKYIQTHFIHPRLQFIPVRPPFIF